MGIHHVSHCLPGSINCGFALQMRGRVCCEEEVQLSRNEDDRHGPTNEERAHYTHKHNSQLFHMHDRMKDFQTRASHTESWRRCSPERGASWHSNPSTRSPSAERAMPHPHHWYSEPWHVSVQTSQLLGTCYRSNCERV